MNQLFIRICSCDSQPTGAILKIGKYSDVEAILIEAVRKHPCLWNTSEAKYKNRTVKENAWTAVAEEVNAESGKTY